MWAQLEATVRSGQAAPRTLPSQAYARIHSEGVEAWTGIGARALPTTYDFTPHRRLLDVGGGTATSLVIAEAV